MTTITPVSIHSSHPGLFSTSTFCRWPLEGAADLLCCWVDVSCCASEHLFPVFISWCMREAGKVLYRSSFNLRGDHHF
ncbi:hypothetical protein AMECASPLE_031235 [Ameca splendens]|uniref:Uncharacterized protein n=1 Tax=Ameca splendens TaxID=208324 RepID=A0ABV1ACK9_9TELE